MKSNLSQSRNPLLGFTVVLLGVFLLKYLTEGPLPPISGLQLGIFIFISAIIIVFGVRLSLPKRDGKSDKKDDRVKTTSQSQPLTNMQGFIIVALGLLLAFNVSTLWMEWASDTRQLAIQIMGYIISILLGLAVAYWAFYYFTSRNKKRSGQGEPETK